MPQVDRSVVKARATRLRAVGAAAHRRHLDAQVGRPVRALVEREGRARAEDFTEVAFQGEATPGVVIAGVVAGHDGERARLDAWTPYTAVPDAGVARV
jgi:threonylcarbamoyladenosine tRNA methylthiotransferase MtaB